MKLSLYTLLTLDLSLEESIAMAKKCGYDAVDIRMAEDGAHFPLDVTDEQVKQTKTMADDAGLEVSGVTTYYWLGVMDQIAWQDTLKGFQRAFEICHLLGARFLRCSGPMEDPAGYEAVRSAFRTKAEEIGKLAAQNNVIVTIEQHGGTLVASAGQVLDMMRGVATDHLGVVYDPGNCIGEGYERPSVQIDMMRDIIKAVHVKNYNTIPATEPSASGWLAEETSRLDQPILDWKSIMQLLKDIGYNNYITLEDFHTFPTLEEKLTFDAQYLRSTM